MAMTERADPNGFTRGSSALNPMMKCFSSSAISPCILLLACQLNLFLNLPQSSSFLRLFCRSALFQHKVRCVFRCLPISDGESECTQVEAIQQRLALPEQDRRQREMNGVDEIGLKILAHRRY